MSTALALTRAAVKDAAALVSAAVQYALLDPVLCRVAGHHWHVWSHGHHPVLVCDRCGRKERAY